MSNAGTHDDAHTAGPAPLVPLLIFVFLASIGTGVFWNAIAFVAKHGYGFTQTRTFVLAMVMGLVYTAGAFSAGRIMRWCERLVKPRTLLALTVVAQGVICVPTLLARGEWALWVAAAGVSIASSVLWPITESYVTADRHGAAMRGAIGWFNVVWMTAVFVPLLVMPAIIEQHAEWAIGAQVVLSVLALPPVLALTPAPGQHDPERAEAHVPPEYARLLSSARVLLPLSYLLFAAMSAVLPYRFEAVGADVRVETPVAALWMIVRLGVVALMWRTGFWHGRRVLLALAGVAMALGFALVVLASSLPPMMIGFCIFGAGNGMVYYSALYYAMAVGRAAVDASGTHEGLIGAGYAAGPATGLAGTALASALGLRPEMCIVALAWVLTAGGAVEAVRRYVVRRPRVR